MRASLGPPLRATTARWKTGVSVSGIAGHDTTATFGSRWRRSAAGAHSAADRSAGAPGSVLAAIRDVGDDGVLASEDRRLEALGGLVVEQPVPPVAGHVLRQ